MTDKITSARKPLPATESGNVFFFILLAIVLIGLVTVALRSSGGRDDIDAETLTINVTSVRQYASELERGVTFILQNGASENDIRFANKTNNDYGDVNDDPEHQVFADEGGGVGYSAPIPAVSSASQWEFYGHVSLPEVGSSNPELIAVLPDVTQAFCKKINEMDGYDPAIQPLDSSGSECVKATNDNLRFTSTQQFTTGGSIDTVDDATFTSLPAMEGCVQCGTEYHFFHVLLAR